MLIRNSRSIVKYLSIVVIALQLTACAGGGTASGPINDVGNSSSSSSVFSSQSSSVSSNSTSSSSASSGSSASNMSSSSASSTSSSSRSSSSTSSNSSSSASSSSSSNSVSSSSSSSSSVQPTISFIASPGTIALGAASTLTWSSNHTVSCVASEAWSGVQSTSGTLSVSPTVLSTYTLICTGPGGNASQSVTIAIEAPHSSATLVFNYPNGFASASGAIHPAWSASFAGSAINLTSTGQEHEAGGAWYTTQQNITSFTTDFTFQIIPSDTVPSIQGITFCIQNTNSIHNSNAYGINASSDANLSGYGTYALGGQQPMINSMAVLFNLNNNDEYNYPSSGHPSATGLYINGGPQGALVPELDLNPSHIDLYSGDIMAVKLVYDGSLLTMTLKDTFTNAQYRTSWPVDIPSITGSSLAWIGFTGGEIPSTPQNILTWDFYDGYDTRVATPTFSAQPGSYPSTQMVSINAPSESTVYYTTNGQQPTTSSSKYMGPITVSSSEVIEAVAVESGYTDSLVAVANYQIAPTNTPMINFSNFVNASSLVTTNGSARLNGSTLQLTDTLNDVEVGSAWYVAPVNVQTFTTNFTLQLTNANANGMTFVIQNQPPASSDSSILYVSGGPNALANGASGLGYSGDIGAGSNNAGLLNSIAVIFDLYDGSGNLTGLYTNGKTPIGSSIDMTSAGVNLHSGNPLAVQIAYDGTILTMTLTDTKTNKTFTHSWTINIPATVGGNTAYIGFTGGTGGATATQQVLSWTYSN